MTSRVARTGLWLGASVLLALACGDDGGDGDGGLDGAIDDGGAGSAAAAAPVDARRSLPRA